MAAVSQFRDPIVEWLCTTEGELAAAPPRLLFEGRFQRGDVDGNPSTNYDESPDGRFIMIQEDEEEARDTTVHVVLNWTEELKRLVPTPE